MKRVEVTITANDDMMISRIFSKVKDIREDKYSWLIIHLDENGEELVSQFSRSNVISIDGYTEAEYKRRLEKFKKPDKPEDKLLPLELYLKNYHGIEEKEDSVQAAIETMESQRKIMTQHWDKILKAHDKIRELKEEITKIQEDRCRGESI